MMCEEEYKAEVEARKRRLLAYAEEIQKKTHENTSRLIEELVAERHRQNITQQELADKTGILPSNLARFESGARIPTLIVLEKYASALGKHIELVITDSE
ncbi:MAG: helix-turn-helix transcriptional regulator [Candidatus Choladocola sp.]|nr:helix-turn-helix transcriptional regulator [Candidatus Choladocola sp.]